MCNSAVCTYLLFRYEQVVELERQVEDATRASSKQDKALAEANTTIADLKAQLGAKDDEVSFL